MITGTKHTEKSRKKMSKSHWNKPMLGKKHSKETILKLKKSHLGIQSGEKHPKWKGGLPNCKDCCKELSTYSNKLNVCKKCSGKYQTGEKNWNWNGGASSENERVRKLSEMKLWKKSVFERDDYTCQKYGTKSGNGKAVKLAAHHIKNFAQYIELRTSIENGITLSEKAHKEFHRKYGIKNNTREQLLEFLTDK